jgi:hypothetical protein
MREGDNEWRIVKLLPSQQIYVRVLTILRELRERSMLLVKTLVAKKTKLRGLTPQANYTDRATASCRRS